MTPKLTGKLRRGFLTWIPVSLCLFLASCSITREIPSVIDDRAEDIVRSEAAHIIRVSEDRENFLKYRFFLSEFPRQDILGISIGNRRIYIRHSLATRALTDSNHRWLLRQTIAHEIAHETASHGQVEGLTWFNRRTFTLGASGGEVGLPWYVRLYNYSTDKELEADLKGLDYWNKLDWDCRIWVQILEDFQEQGYSGDFFHPTSRRLQQARHVCDSQRGDKPPVHHAPPAKPKISLVN